MHLYIKLTTIRQTPPLATAWIYAIMQLNLTYAVLSLVTTYGFIWYKNLRLFPSPWLHPCGSNIMVFQSTLVVYRYLHSHRTWDESRITPHIWKKCALNEGAAWQAIEIRRIRIVQPRWKPGDADRRKSNERLRKMNLVFARWYATFSGCELEPVWHLLQAGSNFIDV